MTQFMPHVNFFGATVLTAPSPATSGTSLTLASGQGAPLAGLSGFELTVWPASSASPTATTAEIVLVSAVSGDTLTFTRGPQSADPGGVNRAIQTGDNVALTDTMKMWTDIEAAVNSVQAPPPLIVPPSGVWEVTPGAQVLYAIPIQVQAGAKIRVDAGAKLVSVR